MAESAELMEASAALKKSCASYRGNLTKRYNELERLLLSRENRDEVKIKVKQLHGLFLTYEAKFKEYIATISGKTLEDALQHFTAAKLNKKEFDDRISSWMTESAEPEDLTLAAVDDDRQTTTSERSAHSHKSSTSTTVSLRVKEARARQKLAAQKLRQHAERKRLEDEKRALEDRLVKLDLNNELEAAELEVQVWEDELDEEPVTGNPNIPVTPTKVEKIVVQGAHESALGDSYVQGVEFEVGPSYPHVDSHAQGVPNLNRERSDISCAQEGGNMHSVQGNAMNGANSMYASQICDAMMMAINMPKPEMVNFDGDPIKYWSFIHTFDVNIANKVVDDGTKLMYLTQFCVGKAREAIGCCSLMNPVEGYRKAREILAQQFGRPHVITHALISKVLNRSAVRPNDGNSLSELGREMRRCLITLEQMGHVADLNASDTLIKVQRLFPMYMQSRWADQAHGLIMAGVEPNFAHMTAFVERSAQVSNNMFGKNIGTNNKDVPKGTAQKGHQRSHGGQKLTTLATQSQGKYDTRRVEKCPCCEGQHKLGACSRFKEKPQKERLRIVRKGKLCDNCFKPRHFAQDCRSDPACEVSGCGRKHHTLLHYNREDPQTRTAPTGVGNAAESQPSSAGTNLSTVTTRKVCLRVVPVKVRGNGKEVQTWAILDDGSDVSLCDKRLAEALGLKGREKHFSLTTISQQSHRMKGREVSLSVSGIEESNTDPISLDDVWTVDRLPVSTESFPKQTDIDSWPHLSGISLPQVEESEVMLLIGGDVPEAFWVIEERRGGRKEPYATRSMLGWTVMGPTKGENKGRGKSVFRTAFLGEEDDLLEKQVERFWQMDSAGTLADTGVGESREDKQARALMEKSIQKVDGHYQLDLPWKHENPYLPDNRVLAEKRLSYLKRRLNKDENLKKMYADTLNGYLEKGHAQAVPSAMDQAGTDRTDRVWYLPHHPVVHPQKPNKVRVVFDCAATHHGVSLNSQLLQGPDFTNSLVGVLTRFRQDKIALVADIEAMFHQVKVSPQDCDALRFLWWPDGDLQEEPREYQMLVHLFGATSSPSCAAFALRKTAEDNQNDDNQEAVKTVLENFYVDDCLKSVQTKEQAIKLTAQLRDLLQKGGFRLTKWISNNHEVLKTIPESERASSVVDLGLGELPTERTLGVLWNVETDQFGFKVAVKNKPTTRRGILSTMSSLYDPLGFVAPFVLTAKILLQDICAQGLSWDEKVGDQESLRWHQWLTELPYLCNMAIDRCLTPLSGKEVENHEIHVFCDASMRGYSAVAYLRSIDVGGDIHCSMVMGKTKLCPMKALTIPRLELSAAVLACTLSQTVQSELRLPISSTVFWTDSTSVLQYIRNESRRFHTFVANRVAKIQSVSDPAQWRHVPTNQNPADDGSRGLHANEMTSDCRWLCGPSFLKEPESRWPLPPSVLEVSDRTLSDDLREDPEVKRGHTHLTSSEDPIDKLIMRYSTWDRLKRGVAWLARFKDYLRARATNDMSGARKSDNLSTQETEKAGRDIIKYVQRHTFPTEFENSNDSERIPRRRNQLEKLNPVIVDGLLRVGGRLGSAPVTEDEKHPLILPHDHHVTTLLVVHHHIKVGHSGAGFTWTSLREKYWIMRGGATVRRIIGKCFDCKKRNAPRGQQLMADLPPSRVTPDKPAFANTGVDFFGPFLVKQGRTTRKRYGCIFTCLASRAVHLEVVGSLDTDGFINALRRFMNRRGHPEKILSDNGTNFKGAERELRESLASFNEGRIGRILSQKGVQWEFNPPGASHMGGAWERIIRTIRKILRSLLGQQLVTDEALATYMTEVEAILNSRPLTQLSSDPRDEEPLTPNHLLLLRKASPLPPGIFSKDDTYGARRWRQVQYLADQFWKRWVKEYLPILQERQKWTRPRKNFAVNDLVLLVDDRTPRGQWALGRITSTYPDKRGFVRQVDVRVGTKSFKRPISKLCLLESN